MGDQENQNLNNEENKVSRIKSHTYIYLMCLNASFGIFFLGFNQGVFNVVQLAIIEIKRERDNEVLFRSLMSSSNPFGGLIGAFIGTYILYCLKTIKRSFIFLDIMGIIATTIMLVQTEFANIIIGRFMQGLVQGVNMALVPIYIREFSPIEILGKTASFVQLGQKGGLVTSYLFGLMLPTKSWFHTYYGEYEDEFRWRVVIFIPIFFCIFRLIGLATCFRFDTPTQALEKGNEEDLKRFLRLVYTERDFDDAYQQAVKKFYEQQLKDEKEGGAEMTKEQRRAMLGDQDGVDHYADTDNDLNKDQFGNRIHMISQELGEKTAHAEYDPEMITESQMIKQEDEFDRIEKETKCRRNMLGWTVSLTVSFSGIDAIFYYSNKIFEEGGLLEYATIFTISIGVSAILFSFMGMAVVDTAGRRPLLLAGSVIMTLSLAGMILGDIIGAIYLVFVCIIFFMFGYNSTLGPVKWACYVELMDEFGVSVAASLIFVFAFVIALVFPFMVEGLGLSGAFAVFLGLSIYCFFYLLIEFKETKGKTKFEIYPMFSRSYKPEKPKPKFSQQTNILEIQGRSQLINFRSAGGGKIDMKSIHRSMRQSMHQSLHYSQHGSKFR